MTDDTIPKGLTRAILQMPEPMRRIVLSALHREAPEMIPEIQRICRLWVPGLALDEARRTTVGEAFDGPRFSAVVITAETDSGDFFAWPNFTIGQLCQHDLQLLELSLAEWLEVVRRAIKTFGMPKGNGPVTIEKSKPQKKEVNLPDIDLADYE